MSSTTRTKDARESVSDFYETPERVALAGAAIAWELSGGGVLFDPCAGRGALLRAGKATGFSDATGIELDPHRALEAGCKVGDALSEPWPDTEVILCNPPFAKALEFTSRAFRWLAHDPLVGPTEGGERHAVFLFRLGFMSALKRRDLFEGRSIDCHHLTPRPSFTGGGTDSAEYAWFAFGPKVRGAYELRAWRAA